MLPVWFLNCTEPDELGVAQYCVPAVTYVARDLWTVKGNSFTLYPYYFGGRLNIFGLPYY